VHDGVCVVLNQERLLLRIFYSARAKISIAEKQFLESITLDLMHARDDRGNLKPRSIAHRIA